MNNYTPTTEQVRTEWIESGTNAPGPRLHAAVAFDRWLAAHDAEVRAGVVAEEPEWEYGVKFDWKPEPSYVGSYENCRYFMDQPNDSLEKHAYPDDTKTLLRRRKAGPWVEVTDA